MKIIGHFKATLRLFYFLILISLYLLNASIVSLCHRDLLVRRQKLIKNCKKYAQLIGNAFGLKTVCKNPIAADENSLLVGNHVGFVDIVGLYSICDCVFITSLEMKNTPGLGQICDLAGCAYVDRKNRMNIQEELKGVTEVLKQGFRVVLYAESVASNGEQVLPFKKTLMMSAGLAGKPIRPFVFNFREVNDGPVLFEHRDSLCWYGKQSFFSAIWKTLHLNSVVCEIEFLPLIYPKAEDDRSVVAKQVHSVVAAKYVPFSSEMNLTAQPLKTIQTV